jgi:hypothetical protein
MPTRETVVATAAFFLVLGEMTWLASHMQMQVEEAIGSGCAMAASGTGGMVLVHIPALYGQKFGRQWPYLLYMFQLIVFLLAGIILGCYSVVRLCREAEK